jgi:FAD/FMN-containing dehydrogenase
MNHVEHRLEGWGNYPVEPGWVCRPHRLDALRQLLVGGDQPDYISRGLGRSYGDSSLNGDRGVIMQTGRNCFLDVDAQSGVLECEAGLSFAEIIEHLLPRGWFLPTTPGTRFVTVGGAIAADIHGKNHHRNGSFGGAVLDLELMVASGEVIRCSPTENSDVFWATVGGMGLTGVILSARIQLTPVETSYVRVDYQRTRNLDETLERFSQTDADYQYSVAWIDSLSRGRSLGRSVIMLGNNASRSQLSPRQRQSPLEASPPRSRSVPFYLPKIALNPWSVQAFNSLYYEVHRDGSRLVDYYKFFYPLDSLLQWNRIYGRRGVVQYQALFPRETSRRGLKELMDKIASSRLPSFLAVLKSSGSAGQGILSYMYPGHTLALDFPVTAGLRPFLKELDELLLQHGGRLYLAKDATMSAETFAAMYPRLNEFKQIKSRIDPENRFVSSQARRLGIVESS